MSRRVYRHQGLYYSPRWSPWLRSRLWEPRPGIYLDESFDPEPNPSRFRLLALFLIGLLVFGFLTAWWGVHP